MMKADELYKKEFGDAKSVPKKSVIRLLQHFGRVLHIERKERLKIIDLVPENMPLYKDSDLWQIRSDNMKDVIYQQKATETFSEFIERVHSMIATEQKGGQSERHIR
jgi:hypothetical protein